MSRCRFFLKQKSENSVLYYEFGGAIVEFEEAYEKVWKELGVNRKMVLSSSFDNIVTSRTMSIIILNRKFYFQTDKTFRKYSQLKRNCNVALCMDNIQIEGICSELGHPYADTGFCDAYIEV